MAAEAQRWPREGRCASPQFARAAPAACRAAQADARADKSRRALRTLALPRHARHCLQTRARAPLWRHPPTRRRPQRPGVPPRPRRGSRPASGPRPPGRSAAAAATQLRPAGPKPRPPPQSARGPAATGPQTRPARAARRVPRRRTPPSGSLRRRGARSARTPAAWAPTVQASPRLSGWCTSAAPRRRGVRTAPTAAAVRPTCAACCGCPAQTYDSCACRGTGRERSSRRCRRPGRLLPSPVASHLRHSCRRRRSHL
mmetsp:Transcript_3199/g.8837  ORF Transcript_3199/g.8837 Transcript_3199/m.8837 type:complete len:257 (-) Transcript_3199:1810-2580(-)